MPPFLRWAGSKRKLLSRLSPFWRDDFDRYIEPFAGSACLFFALAPQRAIIGDINVDLIEMYRTIQTDFEAVSAVLSTLTKSKENYYAIRRAYVNESQRDRRAAQFIYLNRYCFNGLYRTNLSGQFNVPFAPTDTGTLPDTDTLTRAALLLTRCQLICGDFAETLKQANSGDFLYVDPPYAADDRRVFREYHPDSFTSGDLERLASCLTQAHQKGAKFVVSYLDCPQARDILSPWTIQKVTVQRNIAGFAKFRRTDTELLATNID